MKLILNTLTNSRKSLARLMRVYKDGEIKGPEFRNLVYSFAVFLNYFKVENMREIEDRLSAIENSLKDTEGR